jgi:hypothetical protein
MLDQFSFESRGDGETESDPPAEAKKKKKKRGSVADKPKASAVKRATTVSVRSCYPGRIIASNTPSGTRYEWVEAGAIVEVKESDLESVMSKNSDGSAGCCGSGGGRTYFELVS